MLYVLADLAIIATIVVHLTEVDGTQTLLVHLIGIVDVLNQSLNQSIYLIDNTDAKDVGK